MFKENVFKLKLVQIIGLKYQLQVDNINVLQVFQIISLLLIM